MYKKKIADNFNSQQVKQALCFDQFTLCSTNLSSLHNFPSFPVSQTFQAFYRGRCQPNQPLSSTQPYPRSSSAQHLQPDNQLATDHLGSLGTFQKTATLTNKQDKIILGNTGQNNFHKQHRTADGPSNQQLGVPKVKFEREKHSHEHKNVKNRAGSQKSRDQKKSVQKASEQNNKKRERAVSVISKKDIQKLQSYIQCQKLGSRNLPDSKFRDFFGKQCMHNYGGNNTNQIIGGVVYGNYLKTQNVNPHTCGNKPKTYQTHTDAINFSKRTKKPTRQEKLNYLKKANFKKLGFAPPTSQEKLTAEIGQAYDQVINNKPAEQGTSIKQQVKQMVREIHKNTLILGRQVQPEDRQIDKQRQVNKERFDPNGHYLVNSQQCNIRKTKCHSFYHQNKDKPLRSSPPGEPNSEPGTFSPAKIKQTQPMSIQNRPPNKQKHAHQEQPFVLAPPNNFVKSKQSGLISTSPDSHAFNNTGQGLANPRIRHDFPQDSTQPYQNNGYPLSVSLYPAQQQSNGYRQPMHPQSNPNLLIEDHANNQTDIQLLRHQAFDKASKDRQTFNKLLHLGRTMNCQNPPPAYLSRGSEGRVREESQAAYQLRPNNLRYFPQKYIEQLRPAGLPRR